VSAIYPRQFVQWLCAHDAEPDAVDCSTYTSSASNTSSTATSVSQGGDLCVGGYNVNKTVACNDGDLTLYGSGRFNVSGHCTKLTVGATNSQVYVESAEPSRSRATRARTTSPVTVPALRSRHTAMRCSSTAPTSSTCRVTTTRSPIDLACPRSPTPEPRTSSARWADAPRTRPRASGPPPARTVAARPAAATGPSPTAPPRPSAPRPGRRVRWSCPGSSYERRRWR
jgi:hypothetical protein